jgi:hypothetical protein
MLADDPIGPNELRVRVHARELIHEHLDLFNEVLVGAGPDRGRAGARSVR